MYRSRRGRERARPRSCGVDTAGPRPGQVQGEGGGAYYEDGNGIQILGPWTWGCVAQEVSSNLRKGIGRWEPTVGSSFGGWAGPAAAGRGGPLGRKVIWQATGAKKSSYGSAGGEGGGRSSRETVLSWGTEEGDGVGAETSGTGPDEARVDGAINEEEDWDEEVDRPADGLGLFANCSWTDGDSNPSSTYALRLSMLKQRWKTWCKYGYTEQVNK